MIKAKYIKGIVHNGRGWYVVLIGNSYFARSKSSDTGPYSTVEQAEEFIRAIRP